MKSTLAILAAAGLASQVAAQSAAYGQCGGIGWNGAKNCVNGYTCTYSSAYYSQCLPNANGGGNNNGGGSNNGGSTKTVTVYSTQYQTTTVYQGSTVTRFSTATVTNTVTETDTETETETETVGGDCEPSTTDAGPSTTGGDSTPTDPASCDGAPFELYGVNESGAEFGAGKIPGQANKDYTYPTTDSIDYFLGKGFNTFRIPLLLERIAPPSTGLANVASYNQTYLGPIYGLVSYISQNGGKVILDIHNYGRYNGNLLDVEAFGNFWANFAPLFSFSPSVIFDIMNEYNTMPQSLVHQLNQAALSAIRSTGATNLILVEGNSWSGAYTWISSGNADDLIHLYDPGNNFAYEMHQYLDSDGSGTSPDCVSSTIGVERLQSAVDWCNDNGVKCFLGEIGTGTSDTCVSALEGLLCLLKQNNWLGVTWWSAGPWWGTYYQSIEPNQGPANEIIVPILQSYE